MAKSEFTFAVGDRVIFKGYPDSFTGDPIFEEGQVIEIIRQAEAGSDDSGPFERYEAVDPDDTEKADTVYFPDDIEVLAEDQGEEVAETEAAPATKAKASSKGKAKAAAPATEEAPPAKAKSKASTKSKAAPAETKAKAEPKAAAKAGAKTGAKSKATPAATGKAAAKPAAKAAEAQAEGEEAALVLTADVSSLVEDGSAVEAAKDLLHTVDTTYFNLGGVLCYIMEKGAFKELGYKDFFEFCDKELGQQKSKVYQLMRIYRSFSALGVDAERFRQIGWTYARAMSQAVNSDNLEELLDKAGKMSRDDFEHMIRTTYVNESSDGAPAKVRKTKFVFALHEDQAANAEKVIKAIKQELDTEDLNAVFSHLLTFYAQQSEIETTLDDDIAFLEEKHGVELQVVEQE